MPCRVELIDLMGNDLRIVQAARVSYDQISKGPEKDEQLLRYLIKHGHWSPFEQPHMTFKIEAPLFVFRQLMRHRMANYNEVSARYTEVSEEFFMPDEWRMQSTVNKQGSTVEGLKRPKNLLDTIYAKGLNEAFKAYQALLAEGVAREQARMVLPVSMMSKVIMTIDLRNFFNVLNQRLHAGAQKEIQDVARMMMKLVEPYFPVTFRLMREEGRLHGS